jgi:GT2 family glycosyltransferase
VASNTVPSPSTSVVVITRDRPYDFEVCLRAVLASTTTDFDLVVVDQSTQPDAAQHVRRCAARDARVHYVRDPGQGAARARNVGTPHTRGEIIVFTDDDCEPAPDWLGLISRALRDDPSAGMAFGTVTPGPHDPRAGFIIGFQPRQWLRLQGRLAKLRDDGISANVAIRRTALDTTGGFDEMLGPGGYFPCAEDYDLTYRVLSKGFAVVHVPEARVVHHGLRDWASGSLLVHRTYIAIGAAYMKHLRSGDLISLGLLLQEMSRAVINIGRNLFIHRRGPYGFGRLAGLFVGIWRSFELQVDRRRAVYKPLKAPVDESLGKAAQRTNHGACAGPVPS